MAKRSPSPRRTTTTKAARWLLISVALAAVLPGSAQGFEKAIWGPPERGGVSQFPLYRKLGITIYQAAVNWNLVAPSRPQVAADPNDPAYVWPADLDLAIAQAERFHMRVMLQLIGAPSWANGGHADWSWAPRDPRDFSAFATAAARRYPGVRLWMVWGEPTKIGNFQPLQRALPGTRLDRAQQAAPRRYAALLDAAYGALKQVSRRNLVIGGCTFTTGAIDTLQWIQNLRLPNGKPPRMDLYSHNPFSEVDPSFSAQASPFDEVQFSDLHALAHWIDRYLSHGLPIFLSEWTIPTAADLEFGFWVDPPVAARWITDALRLSRRWHRIYALGWIHVYDDPPQSYGGLLTVAGAPKPGFAAFARG